MLTWIDEAIELEATPKAARTITVLEFLKKHNIESSTYYYQMRKPENEKRILQMSLSEAKKGTSEVLEKLRMKAEKGEDKAIELYLKFVLALKDRTDITTDDQKIDFEISNKDFEKLLENYANRKSGRKKSDPQKTV